MRRPHLPAYIDGLIAAYRAGQAGRDLHLGYWDRPPDLATPCGPGEFARAQARLTERIVDVVPLQQGQRAVDIACGLGGTLYALAQRHAEIDLIGLNIDRRQARNLPRYRPARARRPVARCSSARRPGYCGRAAPWSYRTFCCAGPEPGGRGTRR